MKDSTMIELPSGPYIHLGPAVYKLALGVTSPDDLARWRDEQIKGGLTEVEADSLEDERVVKACEVLRAAWEERRLTPLGYRTEDQQKRTARIPHDLSQYAEFLPMSRMDDEGCWLRPKDGQFDPQSWWDGIRFPKVEIDALIAANSTNTEKRRRDRKRSAPIEGDLLLTNKIQSVLAAARSTRIPSSARDRAGPLAEMLVQQGKAAGYSEETVRQILTGRLKQQKRLKIPGYFE